MLSKFLGDYRQRSNVVVSLNEVRGWYGVAPMRAWELFSSAVWVFDTPRLGLFLCLIKKQKQ